jgi:hypothetical protein
MTDQAFTADNLTADDIAVRAQICAAIQIELPGDHHLAKCGLAKAAGPDGTLACAECCRAMWMHSTRHDTCARFCWVTIHTITTDHLIALRMVRGLSHDIAVACSRALNEFGGLGPRGRRRDAKLLCVNAINEAYRSCRSTSVGVQSDG